MYYEDTMLWQSKLACYKYKGVQLCSSPGEMPVDADGSTPGGYDLFPKDRCTDASC